MTGMLTVECRFHVRRAARGRKQVGAGTAPAAAPPEPGRVPRISRLMALALRFEGLVRSGAVASYAELARLGRVTRARVTQVMNLLNLAPDIQETLLFLPRTRRGRDPVILRDLQPIASTLDWPTQRWRWQALASA